MSLTSLIFASTLAATSPNPELESMQRYTVTYYQDSYQHNVTHLTKQANAEIYYETLSGLYQRNARDIQQIGQDVAIYMEPSAQLLVSNKT